MTVRTDQVICTIVAKNYLAFARTLCDSFLAHHPEGKCVVLFIDDIEGFIKPASERFETVLLKDINFPDSRQTCFKYDVTELATSAKPYLLEHLLAKSGSEKLLYMDPDILVTGSLTPLFRKLDDCDILLTPHLDTDYPNDGLRPDDSHILKSGIYNLGFIGVRQSTNTQNFLTWWQGKLVNNCVIDHAKGYFVDQKYIDLAFCLFPNMEMYQEVTANVAYWNLHSRTISNRNNQWYVNDLPMEFFHFSGFNPQTTNELSKHQNRFSFQELHDLSRLFDEYGKLLLNNDWKKTSTWNYQHGFYTNGREINYLERKVFRLAFTQKHRGDPFVRASHSAQFWRMVCKFKLVNKLKQWFSPFL